MPKSDNQLAAVLAFANCFGDCTLIVNMQTRGIYFAANLHKLTTESHDDVIRQGFGFFTSHTDDDGFADLHSVESFWPMFFHDKLADDSLTTQQNYTISCYLSFDVLGETRDVCISFSPFDFSADRKVVTAICTVKMDHSGQRRVIEMHDNRNGVSFVYNRTSCRWESSGKLELTAQEKMIIELAEAGLAVSMIADRMCLTPHAVNYHKRKLFEKLQVRSMSQAISVARESRLL